jgi:hypothetical protein
MKYRRLIALLTASVLVFAAVAIEPPTQAPGAPAKPKPAQPEPEPTPADERVPAEESAAEEEDEPATEEEELPPLPPEVAPAGPSPERFNPTEKVRADFPVSFPIDI